MPDPIIVTVDEASRFLKVLIYGPSGIGKTYLCGTTQDVPQLTPVLYCDAEGGLTTLRERKDLDVVKITDWQTIVEVGNYLVRKPDVYRTWIIDSLSVLFDHCLASVMPSAAETPSQRDWGTVGRKFLTFLGNLYKLPVHIVCTALEKVQKDEFTGAVTYGLDLSGRSQNRAAIYFDVIGRLAMGWPDGAGSDPVRVLQVQPFGKYLAKDRWGLPPEIQDPTFHKIYQGKEVPTDE